MKVSRMRRGWRVSLTDNEFEMLREAVNKGLRAIEVYHLDDSLPYKLRKVLHGSGNGPTRWALPDGPLTPDEDRRAA